MQILTSESQSVFANLRVQSVFDVERLSVVGEYHEFIKQNGGAANATPSCRSLGCMLVFTVGLDL